MPVMSNGIMCGNCGTAIYESRDSAPEERKPCPKCGSKSRKYSVTGVVSASATVSGRTTISAAATVIYSANLLLQTVVIPGVKTREGQLIQAVTVPWGEIVKLLQSDPAIAYQIPPRKWEEIIAGAYKKAGFDEVTLTPHSGDYGRDVIAVKKGLGVIRVIDQVKAYRPTHLVTAEEVRALMGVLQADGASKGFLTTTSDFAPRLKDDPLIVTFMPDRLGLINGKELLERLAELSED
jgi:restriction system protein